MAIQPNSDGITAGKSEAICVADGRACHVSFASTTRKLTHNQGQHWHVRGYLLAVRIGIYLMTLARLCVSRHITYVLMLTACRRLCCDVSRINDTSYRPDFRSRILRRVLNSPRRRKRESGPYVRVEGLPLCELVCPNFVSHC